MIRPFLYGRDTKSSTFGKRSSCGNLPYSRHFVSCVMAKDQCAFFVKLNRNYPSCPYFHSFYGCLMRLCISYFCQQENIGRIYWSISGVMIAMRAFQYKLIFHMVGTWIFQALLSSCIYYHSSAMNRLSLVLRACHPVHHRVEFLRKHWASQSSEDAEGEPRTVARWSRAGVLKSQLMEKNLFSDFSFLLW